MNDYPKRKRGKRAGASVKAAELRDIHSKVRGVAVHSGIRSNFAATVCDAAIFYDAVDANVETAETHVIPRQSLTRKQMLGFFPQRIETEQIPTKQLDKRSGKLIETTDNRIVWKSDKSLLNRTPQDKIGTFKRDGAIVEGLNRRHNRTYELEVSETESVDVPGVYVEVDAKLPKI